MLVSLVVTIGEHAKTLTNLGSQMKKVPIQSRNKPRRSHADKIEIAVW